MMMKWIRRIVLVFGFMLCMISEVSADPQSGVRVSATRDKAYYGQREVACLTVLVENVTDKPIHHVRVEEHLPDGLQLAEGLGVFEIDEIPANSSAVQSFYVRKRSDGLTVVAKTDKAHYHRNEIAELRVVVTNHLDKPVKNVKIEHLLPNGLQYESYPGAYALENATLGPGESIEYAVRVRVMDPLPETGDQSHMQILVYMTVMLTAIVLLIVIGKCRGVK